MTEVPPAASTSRRRHKLLITAGVVSGAVLSFTMGGVIGNGHHPSRDAAAPKPVIVVTPSPIYITVTPSVPPSTAPASPPGPATTFGDGQFAVGVDVAPGTYATTVPEDSRNCYWARESDLSGSIDSVITNKNFSAGSKVRVTILKSDKGFLSNGCGMWVKVG